MATYGPVTIDGRSLTLPLRGQLSSRAKIFVDESARLRPVEGLLADERIASLRQLFGRNTGGGAVIWSRTSVRLVSFRITLHWRQQGPQHEVGCQIVPRSGRQQHRVTGAGEAHNLDVGAVRREGLGKREGLAGVGDAIRRAVGEQQSLVIQRLDQLTRG